MRLTGPFSASRLTALAVALALMAACSARRAPQAGPPQAHETAAGTTATTAPSPRRMSEFFRAAEHGRWFTISQMLKEGWDINVRNAGGQTALHVAAANGHDELVGRLLAHGALLDVQDHNGNTPLHLAVMGDHDASARKLRMSGAKTDIRNNQGKAAAEALP